MPQKQITSYDIIARTHRPVPPHNKAAEEGAANHFDIFLYTDEGDERTKVAEVSFWSGADTAWPDDSFTTVDDKQYLRVNTALDTFAGVVDILRNETNRYFAWREPKGGRAWSMIRTVVEPTGEGE